MNVSEVASSVTHAKTQAALQSAETMMVKQANDMQKVQGQQMLELLASASPSTAGLPDNIGQNLNVVA